MNQKTGNEPRVGFLLGDRKSQAEISELPSRVGGQSRHLTRWCLVMARAMVVGTGKWPLPAAALRPLKWKAAVAWGLGVAWCRVIAIGLGYNKTICNTNNIKRKRKKKIGITNIKGREGLMDWWEKMLFPVRRVWIAVAARVKARKNGGGLLKLHDDIQTCGYEDVRVMWEMLTRSESELSSAHRKRKPRPRSRTRPRPFWRVLVWSPHPHPPPPPPQSSPN
ncbi:uncharacterized protein LOC131157064 [Malania oleifera]|uniref:uncharacterized protein LOC131157064 n=1 Tax=Malania oleifera TaxID=397392 RepID=UPI0025AE40CC|nr:uncharacterized protein LOC131157064 [Malania oleifera]